MPSTHYLVSPQLNPEQVGSLREETGALEGNMGKRSKLHTVTLGHTVNHYTSTNVGTVDGSGHVKHTGAKNVIIHFLFQSFKVGELK